MAVYIDDAYIRYGRMRMCHMIADTTEELRQMADSIGLAQRHIQHQGGEYEHFDVSASYRAKAVTNGAIEVGVRDIVAKIRLKRQRLARGRG